VAIQAGKPDGIMEYWNAGPPWCDSVLTASSGIIAWITVKKSKAVKKYCVYVSFIVIIAI
jgi:hypothetical protein